MNPKVKVSLAAFTLLLVAGTAGYSVIEDWSFLDGFFRLVGFHQLHREFNSGIAILGQYANVGTVTATGAGPCSQPEVSDSDPSHYDGYLEREGCTPGYWKNHPDSWPPTGYSPGQSVASVFAQAAAYPAEGSSSLLEALDFPGGDDVEGAVRILLRAAVAGLLNAAHDGVGYPWIPGQLIGTVDAALASGDRATMIALAAQIDADNNAGCPLN